MRWSFSGVAVPVNCLLHACIRCLAFTSPHVVGPPACLPTLAHSPTRAVPPSTCRSGGAGRLPVPPGPQLGQAWRLLCLLWPPHGHTGPPAAALCAGCLHLAGQRAHAVAAAQPHVRGECPPALPGGMHVPACPLAWDGWTVSACECVVLSIVLLLHCHCPLSPPSVRAPAPTSRCCRFSPLPRLAAHCCAGAAHHSSAAAPGVGAAPWGGCQQVEQPPADAPGSGRGPGWPALRPLPPLTRQRQAGARAAGQPATSGVPAWCVPPLPWRLQAAKQWHRA